MEIGRQRAVVVDNAIETIHTKEGDKPAIVIKVMVGDEMTKMTIWLTDKSLGIARRHLKTLGFDPDKEDFGVLISDPKRLAGVEVDGIVEKNGNYYNFSLPLGNPAPSKSDLAKIQAAMRSMGSGKDTAEVTEMPASRGGRLPGVDTSPSVNLDDIPFGLIATVLGAVGTMVA